MHKSNVWGIIVAAGSGSRYGSEKSKLLEMLKGKSILQRSFEQLCQVSQITGIVIVFSESWEHEYRLCIEQVNYSQQVIWVKGGVTRRESVWNGICSLPSNVNFVVVHDAARPLTSPEKIEAAMRPVVTGEMLASSLGIPCHNTIKQVVSSEKALVYKTLERRVVWQVHTPQVFKKDVLIEAHRSVADDPCINDDAELIERLYHGNAVVLMVQDSPFNIKVTVPEDKNLAEALLRQDFCKEM